MYMYMYIYIHHIIIIIPISSEEPKYFGSHNVKTNVEVMRFVSSTLSERKDAREKKNWILSSVYCRTQAPEISIRTTVTSTPRRIKSS